MSRWRGFGSLLAVLATVGCGSSGSGKPATLDPTFTNVVANVITVKNCGGPLCHTAIGTMSAGGMILGTKAQLYAQLVNVHADGTLCGTTADGGPTSYIRVVPGNPDESLLYLKLNQEPPCGNAMPGSGTPLSQDLITLVHDWIAAGAQND